MTMRNGSTPPGPPKGVELTPENKCSFCPGTRCCQYITQRIDTPRSKVDFDHLLWQVAHENVEIYKEKEGWFLMIFQPCAKLMPDGACGIYETRPQICRDYSNDYCEYDSPAEEGFLLHFRTLEELDEYCRGRFKHWDDRFEA
ncbi:MAG: YkgJ family cysteine cluster protein [Gammaproteobacteria bacterium]